MTNIMTCLHLIQKDVEPIFWIAVVLAVAFVVCSFLPEGENKHHG